MYKAVKAFLSVVLLLTAASACSSGLTYNEYAPNLDRFKPQNLLILPTTVGAYPKAAQAMNEVIPESIKSTGYYSAVITPEMALRKMSTDPGLQNLVVDYVAKLNKLGLSDEEQVKKIAETFNVDSVVITNLSDWSVSELAGSNIYRVAFDMQMVDAKTNTIIWKAGGALPRESTSLFTDPDLRNMASELAATMVGEMPH